MGPVMDEMPLSAADAFELLSPMQAGGRAAVAVSGGPDSMALAFCLKRAGFDIVALIVEHGLRPESAREAKQVAATLSAMDIPAEILPWTHDEIKSRVHVRARDARYALLVAACKARALAALYVAHHREDQAETVLMRFAKGSGIDGLAGMAPARLRDGVLVVRPFLSVPKARLVATCAANGIPFVTDPSNEKEKYARGRLRRVQDGLAEEGFTVERLVDLAARAAEAKDALDFYTDAALRELASVLPSGALRLDLAGLVPLPPAIRLRCFAACLQAVAPAAYPPERRQLAALLVWSEDGEETGRTLHGCRLDLDRERQSLLVMREPAAISDRPVLRGGEDILWDGRWLVRVGMDHAGGTVRPLGTPPHDEIDACAPLLRALVPSGRQRASMPALWQGEKLVAIPAFSPANQSVVTAMLRPPFWVK